MVEAVKPELIPNNEAEMRQIYPPYLWPAMRKKFFSTLANEPAIAKQMEASGRSRHTAGDMNKLEGRYAEHLEMRRLAGEIIDWKFEAVNLCLAKATYLKIDFTVVVPGDLVELHEVKGHWEDDARAKIKVAAQLFPWWTFYGVMWDKKAKDWKFERIARRGENNGR